MNVQPNQSFTNSKKNYFFKFHYITTIIAHGVLVRFKSKLFMPGLFLLFAMSTINIIQIIYKLNPTPFRFGACDGVSTVGGGVSINTVLCKRNANEICRNQRNYANFGTQISNFRFRRNAAKFRFFYCSNVGEISQAMCESKRNFPA